MGLGTNSAGNQGPIVFFFLFWMGQGPIVECRQCSSFVECEWDGMFFLKDFKPLAGIGASTLAY